MDTNTTQLDFLHHPKTNEPQVTGTFYECELYARERGATKIARQLREATDRHDDEFTESYAMILVYTVDLSFNFSDDASPYLTSLETWWQMVQEGKPLAECYLYMIQTVHGIVIRELRKTSIWARYLWRSVETEPAPDTAPEA